MGRNKKPPSSSASTALGSVWTRENHHLRNFAENMRRYSVATPCPGPPSYGIYPGPICANNPPAYLNPTDTFFLEDTANIEYTTEFQASLRAAKPRRPRTHGRKSTFNAATDIYVDQQQRQADPWLEQADGSARNAAQRSVRRSSVLLARPAQKIPLVAPPPPPAPMPEENPGRHAARPSRRRVSAILEERESLADEHRPAPSTSRRMSSLAPRTHSSSELKKDPRRRTIYVPSEDTTIMTIHPGASTKYRSTRAKSPDLGLELVTLSEEETTDLVPALKQKTSKRNSIAVPPRRGALKARSHQNQSVSFAQDVQGPETGKENVPPGGGYNPKIQRDHPISLEKPVSIQPRRPRQSIMRPRVSTIENQSTSPQQIKRKRIVSDSSVISSASPAKSLKARAHTSAAARSSQPVRGGSCVLPSKPGSGSPFSTGRSPPSALRRCSTSQRSTNTKRPELERKYPVLREDLARPELYEDNWLEYQEVALTQLINNIFQTVGRNKSDVGPADFRKSILSVYHDPAISLLYKRLQASLCYGALNAPNDVLSNSLRLKDDIGLRQKFVDLWVETYDLSTLKGAVEVVVGREILVPSRSSTGSITSTETGQRRHLKRAIEDYISSFLINNEDAVKVKTGVGSIASIARGYEQHTEDFGSPRWLWRRTVLRSLMLILLLDKLGNQDLLTSCLFQSTSPHKSSASVLQAFAKMLLPSYGDISRPLGHVDYHVSHIQYPLQEYKYSIKNMATDLRDGVVLSRLVEILLYSQTQLLSSGDETVTITLPAGDILSSHTNDERSSWILSQHLKLPCTGHAQKYYNVQIALSALQGTRGIASRTVNAITADDIVDGHREKTLGLLWSIVGKWGLKDLVDWKEVKKEITRLRGKQHDLRYDDESSDSSEDEGSSPNDPNHYATLLQTWASAIAHTHGIAVTNLTTSFSDNRVFEAIVDEYLPFCSTPNPLTTTPIFTSPRLTLADKLGQVGCSRAFIAIFSTPSAIQPIPSRDFTFTSLAFLASRLLPLSIAHRAGAVISRFWRGILARREVTKRVKLMRLASHCAMVVQTRERVVGAAVVLQRAWRRCLVRRAKKLGNDVGMFQALARGWLVRNRLGAGRGGGWLAGGGTGYRAGW